MKKIIFSTGLLFLLSVSVNANEKSLSASQATKARNMILKAIAKDSNIKCTETISLKVNGDDSGPRVQDVSRKSLSQRLDLLPQQSSFWSSQSDKSNGSIVIQSYWSSITGRQSSDTSDSEEIVIQEKVDIDADTKKVIQLISESVRATLMRAGSQKSEMIKTVTLNCK